MIAGRLASANTINPGLVVCMIVTMVAAMLAVLLPCFDIVVTEVARTADVGAVQAVITVVALAEPVLAHAVVGAVVDALMDTEPPEIAAYDGVISRGA